MAHVLLNLDVDDIEQAITFYTRALELRVGRRFDSGFVELLGAQAPLYLLQNDAGKLPFSGAKSGRAYDRHWTPLHLDFVVPDMTVAVERALAAGAQLEEAAREHPYGLLALLSDPFGHGFCLIEFRGGGYAELPHTQD